MNKIEVAIVSVITAVVINYCATTKLKAQEIIDVCDNDCSEIQEDAVRKIRSLLQEYRMEMPIQNIDNKIVHEAPNQSLITIDKEGNLENCMPNLCYPISGTIDDLLKEYRKLLDKLFPKQYT